MIIRYIGAAAVLVLVFVILWPSIKKLGSEIKKTMDEPEIDTTELDKHEEGKDNEGK